MERPVSFNMNILKKYVIEHDFPKDLDSLTPSSSEVIEACRFIFNCTDYKKCYLLPKRIKRQSEFYFMKNEENDDPKKSCLSRVSEMMKHIEITNLNKVNPSEENFILSKFCKFLNTQNSLKNRKKINSD